MKFFVKDFFYKCDQKSNLLEKSFMENFIFCAVVHNCPTDVHCVKSVRIDFFLFRIFP